MRFFVINVNFCHVKDTSRPKTKIIKRIISRNVSNARIRQIWNEWL